MTALNALTLAALAITLGVAILLLRLAEHLQARRERLATGLEEPRS